MWGRSYYSYYFWVGVCRPVLKTLTSFQTKIYNFPYPISDLTLKMYTLFQTLWGVVISATLNRFTAYGTSWRPKRCSRIFLDRYQCPRQHTLPKNGIPDQTDGIHTLFQTKMAKSIPYFRLEMLENGTPLGRHIPIWLIYGSTPPPPPPPPGHVHKRQDVRSHWNSLILTYPGYMHSPQHRLCTRKTELALEAEVSTLTELQATRATSDAGCQWSCPTHWSRGILH